jgi:glycosyltransferase involved in cell wall biosynthesis
VAYGARQATAITLESATARQATLSYGVDPDRIRLIGYPGVDRRHFYPVNQAAAKAKLGLTDQPLILWPRGLGEYFNSEVFMAAAAQVADQYPTAIFMFLSEVGGSQILAQHQHWAEQLGIADRCQWRSQIPYGEMPLYYGAADVVVSLSSRDSRPNMMLEAMACGRLVVMSDIPQIREWIQPDQNGYLVNPRYPDMVARAINQALDPAWQDRHKQFVQFNLELVKQRGDSVSGSASIRQLVQAVAHITKSV